MGGSVGPAERNTAVWPLCYSVRVCCRRTSMRKSGQVGRGDCLDGGMFAYCNDVSSLPLCVSPLEWPDKIRSALTFACCYGDARCHSVASPLKRSAPWQRIVNASSLVEKGQGLWNSCCISRSSLSVCLASTNLVNLSSHVNIHRCV